MPLTLFSVSEARAWLEEQTGHTYTTQAVNKAILSGKLWADRLGELNVVSQQALQDYLEKWARPRPKK